MLAPGVNTKVTKVNGKVTNTKESVVHGIPHCRRNHRVSLSRHFRSSYRFDFPASSFDLVDFVTCALLRRRPIFSLERHDSCRTLHRLGFPGNLSQARGVERPSLTLMLAPLLPLHGLRTLFLMQSRLTGDLASPPSSLVPPVSRRASCAWRVRVGSSR